MIKCLEITVKLECEEISSNLIKMKLLTNCIQN